MDAFTNVTVTDITYKETYSRNAYISLALNINTVTAHHYYFNASAFSSLYYANSSGMEEVGRDHLPTAIFIDFDFCISLGRVILEAWGESQ
ncbi:hypothetical protein LshimejAT787_0309990 [Lyophyllum shimeji]|uniref:Uncharacterized protein n=1 Tax=Lyophyllum shimeji TaxID=47721 RepID=A0A9P3PIC6_LYOSH|nr:hypothetical protein LshimejAT787_0309990 [Lyophyllum shimeji]